MFNNFNKGNKKMPNISGTEPEDIKARLNSMYGNLSAHTPGEVKTIWRAPKFGNPPMTELEWEAEQERNRELNKWFRNRRAHRTQDKEVPKVSYNLQERYKAPGAIEGQAPNKVHKVGLPCNCNHSSVVFQCGDCKMSFRGRAADTGQKDASSSIQESTIKWEKFVPLPNDSDEEL